MLLVAEVLGHGQAGQADPLAGAGRLVHLAEDEGGLGDDARFGHLVDEVVALAAALADAGEDRHAGVLLGDVPDQLLDDDRLADAGTTEDADLAALLERADQVDDLEPGLEDLDLGRLLVEGRRVAVDRQVDVGLDRALLVDRRDRGRRRRDRGSPRRPAPRSARRYRRRRRHGRARRSWSSPRRGPSCCRGAAGPRRSAAPGPRAGSRRRCRCRGAGRPGTRCPRRGR